MAFRCNDHARWRLRRACNVTAAATGSSKHMDDRSILQIVLKRGELYSGSQDDMLRREWLVTNGLGGYACGTLAGACSRRYHGVLVAALPSPQGRVVTIAQLEEELWIDGGCSRLTAVQEYENEHPSDLYVPPSLSEFRLRDGLPEWTFQSGETVLEKRLMMVHLENTTLIEYRLLSSGMPVTLVLRPWLAPRPHEAAVCDVLKGQLALVMREGRIEIVLPEPLPRLKLKIDDPAPKLVADARSRRLYYRVEDSRGYECVGPVHAPSEVQIVLKPGAVVSVLVSTEAWNTIDALTAEAAFAAEARRRFNLIESAHPVAQSGMAAALALAADQFVIIPPRRSDEVLAHASGDEPRTVIAGYHWFTDWGRDTMISLEGLTLVTGRHQEAAYILRTFARHVQDGLIPNLFPERGSDGLYHTADASLWFVHAAARYVSRTGDRATLRALLPVIEDIVMHHLRGTHFGIVVDARDGLLQQGAEGYQLTWMDAKVGDWVVTPRRGKAVEINALWYNALCLLAGWLREEGRPRDAASMAQHAERARASFEQRFWYEAGGYVYDVVDGPSGDDASCRPNQLFAIALDHPILSRERWASVLAVVRERLLTPVGLRTLDPAHPDYQPIYDGNLRARDAAYHQGTVWAWLIGPFVDAWVKTHPHDPSAALEALQGVEAHLSEACIGTINEIFDAKAPYLPRGCVAQAWSVAESLRAWLKLRMHLAEQ
jgi:predicted glycogen debranching enzyme